MLYCLRFGVFIWCMYVQVNQPETSSFLYAQMAVLRIFFKCLQYLGCITLSSGCFYEFTSSTSEQKYKFLLVPVWYYFPHSKQQTLQAQYIYQNSTILAPVVCFFKFFMVCWGRTTCTIPSISAPIGLEGNRMYIIKAKVYN